MLHLAGVGEGFLFPIPPPPTSPSSPGSGPTEGTDLSLTWPPLHPSSSMATWSLGQHPTLPLASTLLHGSLSLHPTLVLTVRRETEAAFPLEPDGACLTPGFLVLRVLWFNSDFSTLSQGTTLCSVLGHWDGKGSVVLVTRKFLSQRTPLEEKLSFSRFLPSPLLPSSLPPANTS